MSPKELLHWFKELGNKPHYQTWESFLVRKINFISLIGGFNVLSSLLIFPQIGLHGFSSFLLPFALCAFLVVIINSKFGYIAGSFAFYIIGIVLMFKMSVELGPDSLFHLFYFPIILSVVQLLGRRETVLVMISILILFFISLILMVMEYKSPGYSVAYPREMLTSVQSFSIILSCFTGIVFVIQITIENNKQEVMIKNSLKEKEILMAEIFHRVKNNMNIVTSLLNLKKNSSESTEVRDALEDCRNRVFSMALVHQKIFNRNNITGLDFGEYATDLIKEIRNSLNLDEDETIRLQSEQMDLPLNQAIPCGLILNELITNSCKHAVVPGRKLTVDIELSHHNGKKRLIVKDNGPGIPANHEKKNSSLGMDLITSLCEQIDGTYSFMNENGLKFELVF